MLSNFTCRGRTLQLSPPEAALALEGKIELSLKRRSAVFYWAHAAEEEKHARHEAICKKNAGWHLRSFGSHGPWALKAQEKCGSLAGVAKNVRRGELDSCKAQSLADLPEEWKAASGVSNATRGAGWWRWKPYYLLRELRSVPPGDVIVHADYDLVFSASPAALWCLGQNERRGVASFHFPCLTDRAWTKRETAVAVDATAAQLDSSTLYAGLLVVRRTPEAESFLEEWLALTLRGELATDHLEQNQDPKFIAHRHDQALLSLLIKKRRLKSFPMPTRTHDIRDVWAWEAGYCQPGFEWPLPGFRPSVRTPAFPRGMYITHYKELGHMSDSTRHCLQNEPHTPYVPLPDYVGSTAVLAEMRAHAQLVAAANARGRNKPDWSPAALAAAPSPYATALVEQERSAFELSSAGAADCAAGTTFGGMRFAGRPYLWTARGCRGIFTCAGSTLRCGTFVQFEYRRMLKARASGKGWLTLCSCDQTESLLEGRHWRDGKDHAANAARSVTVTYREPTPS